MASVRVVEVNYPRDDIGVEGSVISKGQGIRHFQKLNPDVIVVSVNKFQMNWEKMRIECSFSVKDKYVENTVPKEQFLEIMTTNSNLLRDLEAAKEKIAELEDLLDTDAEVDCNPEDCDNCTSCACDIEEPVGINPIVKYDENFATTQETLEDAGEAKRLIKEGTTTAAAEALEISSIEAASPVEEKTITDSCDGGCTDCTEADCDEIGTGRADLSDEELDDGK
jgi:hypothetical protein